MFKRTTAIMSVISISLALVTSPADALDIQADLQTLCSTPTAIWVRGSGVERNDQSVRQMEKYAKEYLGIAPDSANLLELGRFVGDGYENSEKYAVFDRAAAQAGIEAADESHRSIPPALTYPAATVGTKAPDLNEPVKDEAYFHTPRILNSLGARISAGYGHRYGKSVWTGVAELTNLIERRVNVCEQIDITPKFLLFGFSQGAQVVGDTIATDQAVNGHLLIDSKKPHRDWPGVEPDNYDSTLIERYSLGLRPDLREHIVFSALLGDPKLHLPEGEWKAGGTPACSGKSSSLWRRGVKNCRTDNGSLEPRLPYLNAQVDYKTGLWCNDNDFVCGSSKNPLTLEGHKYHNDLARKNSASGRIPLEEAMIEAQMRLNGSISDNTSQRTIQRNVSIALSKSENLLKPSETTDASTPQDLVFLIDSTTSMQPYIEGVKQFVRETAKELDNSSQTRIALVEYKDHSTYQPGWETIEDCKIPAGTVDTACVLSDFSDTREHFLDKLDGIDTSRGGGAWGDFDETALYGLHTAFEKLDWQNGATKAVFLLTDAGFKDPDPTTDNIRRSQLGRDDFYDGKLTAKYIAKRSLEIDPVNIYPIVPNSKQRRYTELADLTSGQVISMNDKSPEVIKQAIGDAFDRVQNRPVAKLPQKDYSGQPNTEFAFDAGLYSYSPASEIVRFDYDFDGDGTWDVTDAGEIGTHIYNKVGDYQMQVRVTDANGLIGSHSVPVHIGTETPKPAPIGSIDLATIDNGNSAKLEWASTAEPNYGWLISSNSVPLAYTASDLREITITDLDRRYPVDLRVTAINRYTEDEDIQGASANSFLRPTEAIQIDSDGKITNNPWQEGDNSSRSSGSTASSSSKNDTQNGPTELSAAAIAGIVVSVIVATGTIGALVWPYIEPRLRRMGLI
ncbi:MULTISPECIES: PKD domain-containing protein [Corynebacterium]|uniref:VWA domain-containing protein n=1 Tax=Corynebacterium lipophilum TaxID=2804918 RepID=A0AAW5HW34_9CORY|nr:MULTISPECIES: PKD domain-containing protein [Corynebacterium]MCO6394011.1 VWA domain-containing protein [Corynebacterium lipophilum]MCQ4611370.1 VWA domain-containing protein [Corynebacterium sp. CCUG 51687]MCZ2116094.1 PKD domain-containing protein [Corynebacterium lipophilum]UUA87537.1 PKD domain-containing protein [Corynebacterium pseudogenitalium]